MLQTLGGRNGHESPIDSPSRPNSNRNSSELEIHLTHSKQRTATSSNRNKPGHSELATECRWVKVTSARSASALASALGFGTGAALQRFLWFFAGGEGASAG